MRGFPAAKAHFYFDFVAFFEKATGCANTDLQIMLVCAWSQANFLNLGHVLVLLRIAGPLVLLEPESSQVRNTTHGRIGGARNLDEVEAGLFGPTKRFVDRHDAQLLAFFVDNANLRGADLAIRPRARGGRRSRIKWSTRYGRLPPYFFLGPLLAIGGLGADFSLLPPFLDISPSSVPRSPGRAIAA